MTDPITLQAARAGGTVLVELLADRNYKDDCQASTGIVWRGKGDVQPYPAALWPKLAVHPTVWGLVPEAGTTPPSSLSPQELAKNETIAEAERVRALAEAAAGSKVDLVHIEVDPAAGAANLAAVYDYRVLTQEAQDAATVEQLHELAHDLGYGTKGTGEPQVHPRLGEAKLRPLFAEITAARLAKMPAPEADQADETKE